MISERDKQLYICFFPPTYNGFNPGFHCRQMLGRYHIDWPVWADEGLIDGIRLNVDHRRFGYDDWLAHSAAAFRPAQEKGVRMLIDCAIEQRYDKMENAPKPLPVAKKDDPETFFHLMQTMTEKMLTTMADGVFFYEHCGNDERTWQAISSAKNAARIS